MEISSLSQIFSFIALITGLGSTVFSVGVHFGYIRSKFTIYDELSLDYYKHANDENKHFSARDWKHLNDSLEDLKKAIDELKSAINRK